MKTIDLVKLNEQGIAEDLEPAKDYFSDNGSLPEGNYFQEDGQPVNIAGEWLLIDQLLEVDNERLVHINRSSDDTTLIKLPQKYVEEDYLVDYTPTDECPLGIDVLVREDGYTIGVVTGCKSIEQAKTTNELDGHYYKGDLGFKINDDYFITYDGDQFKMITL